MKILKFHSKDTKSIPCKILNTNLKLVNPNIQIESFDVSNNQNAKFISQYNILYVPTIILVNDKYKEITRIHGWIDLEKLHKFMKENKIVSK